MSAEDRVATMRTMTLLDGTQVKVGDTVRAKGEGCGRYRNCKVLEIFRGGGVDRAIVTAPIPFGTVIRSRYQIKAQKAKR